MSTYKNESFSCFHRLILARASYPYPACDQMPRARRLEGFLRGGVTPISTVWNRGVCCAGPRTTGRACRVPLNPCSATIGWARRGLLLPTMMAAKNAMCMHDIYSACLGAPVLKIWGVALTTLTTDRTQQRMRRRLTGNLLAARSGH